MVIIKYKEQEVEYDEPVNYAKYSKSDTIGSYAIGIESYSKNISKRGSRIEKIIPPKEYSIRDSDFSRLEALIKENSQIKLDTIREFK